MYIIRSLGQQNLSYNLALVHLIPFWLGWAKIVSMVQVALTKQPKNQFKAENRCEKLTTPIYIQQKLTFCLLSNHLDPVLFVFFIDLSFKLCVINQVSCIAFVPILQLRLLYQKCINKSESNHEKTSNRVHEKTCFRQTM